MNHGDTARKLAASIADLRLMISVRTDTFRLEDQGDTGVQGDTSVQGDTPDQGDTGGGSPYVLSRVEYDMLTQAQRVCTRIAAHAAGEPLPPKSELVKRNEMASAVLKRLGKLGIDGITLD